MIARRLLDNRAAAAGIAVVLGIIVLALAAPLLPLADPHATALDARLLPPLSPGHPLGTDQLGRDVLARLLWGTRVSLAVAAIATAAACVAGTAIGLVAGFYGRWIDALLMRAIDVLLAFPYLLLALAIVAALGPGLDNAMLAIAIVNVPFFARAVRGVTLELGTRPFVEAARLAGFGRARILGAEILPNVLPAIVVMSATTLGWMLLETAGLSFLGLGAQPPQADLGSMLGDARGYILAAPAVALMPGVVILVVVIAINLAADGLRDALDPRLANAPRARAAAPEAPPPRSAGSATPPALEVTDLEIAFPGADGWRRAVCGVSLSIGRGEALGLLGESGCGKSLTALAALGLVEPPGRVLGGSVRLAGEELRGAAPARLRALRGGRIGYIPQDPTGALNPLLTAGEQIAETVCAHRDVSRDAARRRALELIERVGLPDPERRAGEYPHELSGGMRQRIAIAIALANDPSLVIADEPTTALDVTTQAGILDLLDALRREKEAALLFISHDLAVVARLCERALVMYAGRIVEAAATEALIRCPRHPYTRGLIACTPELGQADNAIEPIPGLPPAPGEQPPGCAFAPRCGYAVQRCSRPPIRLEPFARDHEVRCIRAAEIAAGAQSA